MDREPFTKQSFRMRSRWIVLAVAISLFLYFAAFGSLAKLHRGTDSREDYIAIANVVTEEPHSAHAPDANSKAIATAPKQ